MAVAKAGDTVLVHYKGTLTDGTLFDSSEGREPLEFVLGQGMVITGFDNGVEGMNIGDKKILNIPLEEAYGPVAEDAIIELPLSEVPADIPFEVGMQLNMHQDGTGQVMPVVVINLTETHVTLDANHPLAGKALIFDIELVGIA